MGAGEEVAHPPVDLGAETRGLAAADALHAHGAHEVVHRARGDALDIGLLDRRRERLLRRSAGHEESREAGAAAELGDAPLDGADAGLPVAVPVAVARHQPIRAAFAMGGAGPLAHFQLHQALRGEADHLAQEGRVGALLLHLPKGDLHGRPSTGSSPSATEAAPRAPAPSEPPAREPQAKTDSSSCSSSLHPPQELEPPANPPRFTDPPARRRRWGGIAFARWSTERGIGKRVADSPATRQMKHQRSGSRRSVWRAAVVVRVCRFQKSPRRQARHRISKLPGL